MRLGDARRTEPPRPFRISRGFRRLRSRNDTEYLLSNPANAKWIFDSIAEVRGWRMRLEESIRRAAAGDTD